MVPLQAPLAVQDVALVELQEREEVLPELTDDGLAVNEVIAAGGVASGA